MTLALLVQQDLLALKDLLAPKDLLGRAEVPKEIIHPTHAPPGSQG